MYGNSALGSIGDLNPQPGDITADCSACDEKVKTDEPGIIRGNIVSNPIFVNQVEVRTDAKKILLEIR